MLVKPKNLWCASPALGTCIGCVYEIEGEGTCACMMCVCVRARVRGKGHVPAWCMIVCDLPALPNSVKKRASGGSHWSAGISNGASGPKCTPIA
jgi:hypothetical protein